jgi:hypothetical protein
MLAALATIPRFRGIKKIGLDAVAEMPYPRRLKSTARLTLDDDSTENVVLIHVDGSAPGKPATTGFLRTRKPLSLAWM